MLKRYRVRIAGYSLLGLAALALLAFVFGGGFYRWNAVCRVCGAERTSTEVFWVYPVHRVQQSPLSEFLMHEKFVRPHEHDWQFGSGGGAGITCKIGVGRDLFRISRSAGFLRFLAAVKRYHGEDEAHVWLDRGLDAEQAYGVSFCFAPQESDVVNREVFDQWFASALQVWNDNANAGGW